MHGLCSKQDPREEYLLLVKQALLEHSIGLHMLCKRSLEDEMCSDANGSRIIRA